MKNEINPTVAGIDTPATEIITELHEPQCDDQPAPNTTESSEPDPTPSASTPASPVTSPDQLARMLAEAEHRGYLRGRNEQIDLAMKTPPLWHEGGTPCTDTTDHMQPTVLANLRPSIWD